jgi:hypothetical protein
MGKLPSWIVVAAVGALVVLAAADALRSTGEGPPRASVPPAETKPQGSASDLQGMIVIGSNCSSLKVLRLPDLIDLQPPRQMDCDGIVWSQDGTLYASCFAAYTNVGTSEGRRIDRVLGCSPAWRADGALGVIWDGDLLVWRRHGTPRVFLSKDDLADELGGTLEGARTYRLVDVAWRGTDAFFGIAGGSKPWQRALIGYSAAERINYVIPELGQDISDVRVSPSGNYIAFARSVIGREIVVMAESGEVVPVPRIANARAIAWSPDERWVAISNRNTTFIARTGTERAVFEVPAGGESLAWLP